MSNTAEEYVATYEVLVILQSMADKRMIAVGTDAGVVLYYIALSMPNFLRRVRFVLI